MKSLIIATLFAASAFTASAMSGDGGYRGNTEDQFSASKTRAEVIAELREAQAAGTIAYGDANIRRHEARRAPSNSTLTRAEVRKEVAELAAQGNLFQNNNYNGGNRRN
jgi:hypothetical protein